MPKKVLKTLMEVPENKISKSLNLNEFASIIKKEVGKINPDIVSDPNKVVDFISSGNLSFDLVSNGGWPRRRISEIFGMEHSGKSSMVYKTFADLQRSGGLGILIDYEGSWEPGYAKKTFNLVEDGKTFLVVQPDTVEEGDLVFEKMQSLAKIDLVVIDSIDAMKPKALIECSLLKDAKIGAHAMAVGRTIAKFKRFARLHNAAVVFTNQIRSKINIQQGIQNTGTGSGFNIEEPYTTPGGWSVRFYASLRIKLEFGGQQKDDSGENFITGESEKTRIGNIIKIINVKNKVGTPMLKMITHYDFSIGNQIGGWNRAKDIMCILKKRGRLSQVRGSLTYNGLKIKDWVFKGSKASCEEAFASDTSLLEDGEALIRDYMMGGQSKFILDKVQSFDITKEDIDYQDKRYSEQEKMMENCESIYLEEDEDPSLN